MAMNRKFDISILREQLERKMAQKGVKPTTLSLQVGKSPTLVKDLLEKTNDVKLSTISKLAEALNCDMSELVFPEDQLVPVQLGPTLYVKGEVAAGEWVEAYEYPEKDWMSFTGRSDVKADRKHRFGLRVSGDSMDEIYPPGTIVECVSVFGHMDIEPGKKVVVLRRRTDQALEATVKELVEIKGDLWLRPRSRNPEHQSIKVSEQDADIEETRIIAVVVASVRPE
jgi:SOS-response transcriptional repressor LexA